jgi:hypothetical protein
MKKTVTEFEFVQAFDDYNRGDNFTAAGRKALFDYLTDLEDDTGIEQELDVISVCCEFLEYENMAEFQGDYGNDYQTIDDIREVTQVIEINDERFIVMNF